MLNIGDCENLVKKLQGGFWFSIFFFNEFQLATVSNLQQQLCKWWENFISSRQPEIGPGLLTGLYTCETEALHIADNVALLTYNGK